MSVHQFYEICYAGDDRIAWSGLLEDERFAGVMTAAVTPAAVIPREAPAVEPGIVDVA
jgi:hypothetical protein